MVSACRAQSGIAALALILLLAGTHAADQHSNNRHAGKAHISLVQAHGTTAKKSNLRAAAQKGLDVASQAELDDADEDDDTDDDDEKKADEAEDKKEAASEQKAEKALEDEEEEALEAARLKRAKAQDEVESFKDDKSFNREISAEVKMITNETQSASLSNFLGEIRTELRMYSKPSYPIYLEAKVEAAEKRVAELEAELGKTPEKKPEKKAPKKEEKAVAEVKLEAKPKKKEDVVKEAEKEVKFVKAGSAADVAQKASETWALSFFANIAMLAVVFAMASAKDALIRGYTWFLIDQVVAIFIAVMYFQAFDSMMDFGSFEKHNHILCTIVHAVLMLGMILFLAHKLRNDDVGLAILCGAGAHIVSFSSIHAAANVQNKVWLSLSFHWLMCIFGLIVLGLGLLIIGYLVYTAKKKAQDLTNDNFMDKTDDMENDFGAMAFSVVFTMFMRFIITGHHPEDDESEFDHTREQRMGMFIYALVCVLVAAFAVTYLSKKAAEEAAKPIPSYLKKRMFGFFTTVASMNVAWAFLYWGEWEFFETLYPGEAVKGRVMFAIVSTVLGGLALICLAKMPKPRQSNQQVAKVNQVGKGAELVAVTAISLVVAWSWELCFDAAVEDMTEGVSHPVGWKIGTCLTLFAIIIPVYAWYLKPACKRNGLE